MTDAEFHIHLLQMEHEYLVAKEDYVAAKKAGTVTPEQYEAYKDLQRNFQQTRIFVRTAKEDQERLAYEEALALEAQEGVAHAQTATASAKSGKED
jgi:hypothetical protein